MSDPVSDFIKWTGWPVTLQVIGLLVLILGGNRFNGNWDTFISGILILAGLIVFFVGLVLSYRSKISARFLAWSLSKGIVVLALAMAVLVYGSEGAIFEKYRSLLAVRTDDASPTPATATPTMAPAWYDEVVKVASRYYTINNSATNEDEFAVGWEMLSSAVSQNHSFEDDYGFWLGNESNPEGVRAKVTMYDCGDPVLGIRLDYFYREDVNHANPIGSFDELFVALSNDNRLFIYEGGLSNCDLISPGVPLADSSFDAGDLSSQPDEGSTFAFIGMGALIVVIATFGYILKRRSADAQPRLVIENNWNHGEGGLWAHVLTIKNTAPYNKARAIARETVAKIQFFDLDENPITEPKESHFWNSDFPIFPHVIGDVRPVEKPDIHPQETAYLPIAYRVNVRKEIFEYRFESRTDQGWAQKGKSLGSRAIYVDVWIEGRNIKRCHLQRYLLKFQQKGLDAQEAGH